jgi:hypothetical protein
MLWTSVVITSHVSAKRKSIADINTVIGDKNYIGKFCIQLIVYYIEYAVSIVFKEYT